MATGVPFVAIGSPAGGDLTSTYPDPVIAPGAITSDDIAYLGVTFGH